MKIQKSAAQAAAPSSSQNSSAIGFEAPVQYAVTSADAVQMYQFMSSDQQPRMLDTNNPMDEKEILAELPKMDRLGFWRLYENIITEEESPVANAWIGKLEQWLAEQGAHPSYVKPDPYYLAAVTSQAQDQGGIWSQGNVFFSYGVRRETELNRNAVEDQSASPYFRPDAHDQEQHVSRNDSEVATLTQLYDLVTQDLAAQDAGGQARHPLVLSPQMDIGIYTSMGPCIGCQARIELFWTNIQDFVAGLRLGHAVEITLSTYYQSARVGVVRSGVETDYGYAYEEATSLDGGDFDEAEDNRRFVKQVQATVPAYQAPALAASASAAGIATDQS
jgi:hypothetical protein